jgi:hypothetical protein
LRQTAGYLHLPKKQEILALAIEMDHEGSERLTKCLQRGMAVLAFEGWRFESSIRKSSIPSRIFHGREIGHDFLTKHPAIDPDKIVLTGSSMGSYWVPQILACDDRPKAAGVGSVCHEPGMHTIFNEACPSFKSRFMWMSGIEDEAEFDKLAQKMTLKGLGAKIKCPLLILQKMTNSAPSVYL